MKKFGRKLVLSGLALAATAATLSTSTYAWYVSNDNAKVTGANTAVTGGEVGGNLLVAANTVVDGKDTADIYSSSADISNGLANVTLNPFHLVKTTEGETTTYSYVNEKGETVGEAAACQVFKFWVLSSEKTEIYVSTTAANTTTSSEIVKQTSYNKSYSAGSTAVNSQFYVDAGNALRYSVQIGADAAPTFYDNDKFTSTYTALSGAATGGNAHQYYNAILGTPVKYAEDEAALSTSEFTKFTVEKGKETLITIKVWLEGADTECFDSCRAQKFTYTFDLSGTAPAGNGTQGTDPEQQG